LRKHLTLNRHLYICFKNLKSAKQQTTINVFMFVKNLNNNKFLYKDESNTLINIVDIINVDLNF